MSVKLAQYTEISLWPEYDGGDESDAAPLNVYVIVDPDSEDGAMQIRFGDFESDWMSREQTVTFRKLVTRAIAQFR